MIRPLPVLLAVALFALLPGCSFAPGQRAESPIRIGILLPVTGPDALGYDKPLEWALENLNDAGVVPGRVLELVYADIGKEPLVQAAQRLASDPEIVAVIGPDTSQGTFAVVPLFVQAKKVIITPTSTSAELYRAYSKHSYFKRTVPSDEAQVRSLLELAEAGGAKNIALITGSDSYGSTFFDWLGFLAAERGLGVTDVVRYDQFAEDCRGYVDRVLSGGADTVLAVPSTYESAACMAGRWNETGRKVRLLFSDSAESPSVVAAVGRGADGIEGIGLASDPANGFVDAFKHRFGTDPTPYAANVYDALLLIGYGLARSRGESGPSLSGGIGEIVNSTGENVAWDAAGIRKALPSIRSGDLPDIGGASGPLEFDRQTGTDVISAWYKHWRVTDGRIENVQNLPAGVAGHLPVSSAQLKSAAPGTSTSSIGERQGMWAILVAASNGWENYRHQADVLAVYRLLRANGVSDERIVLIMDDDIARNSANKDPGVLRHEADGENLYVNVLVDYPLKGMTPEKLLSIMSGKESPGVTEVIGSGPGDDLLIFMAGHGEVEGVYLGQDRPVVGAVSRQNVLTPEKLRDALAGMRDRKTVRRVLVAIEACKSGVFGEVAEVQDVFVMGSASGTENALARNYDIDQKVWLADQFSYQFWQQGRQYPHESLEKLFQRAYRNVAGSHVSAFGTNFADPGAVPLQDFISP